MEVFSRCQAAWRKFVSRGSLGNCPVLLSTAHQNFLPRWSYVLARTVAAGHMGLSSTWKVASWKFHFIGSNLQTATCATSCGISYRSRRSGSVSTRPASALFLDSCSLKARSLQENSIRCAPSHAGIRVPAARVLRQDRRPHTQVRKKSPMLYSPDIRLNLTYSQPCGRSRLCQEWGTSAPTPSVMQSLGLCDGEARDGVTQAFSWARGLPGQRTLWRGRVRILQLPFFLKAQGQGSLLLTASKPCPHPRQRGLPFSPSSFSPLLLGCLEQHLACFSHC